MAVEQISLPFSCSAWILPGSQTPVKQACLDDGCRPSTGAVPNHDCCTTYEHPDSTTSLKECKLSLYARSDLMSVSIPITSGGCGATHMRSVTRGVQAKVWKLDCLPCESYLRGDGKPKVIKVIPGDKEQGIPSRMEHVIDAHPQWSNTPEGIPPTPDEQHVNKIRAERGNQQLQQLSALAALQKAGLKIPDEAMWLLEQNFDSRIVRGNVVCMNGHDNTSGSKFCQECGIDMATRGAIEPREEETEDEEPFIDIWKLDFRSLQKMCKEKGLSAKGTADEMRQRLSLVGALLSRAPGLCRRCGGPKRGRAARVASPIARCAQCGDDICERHAKWHTDAYICTRCANKMGYKEYGIAQRRISPPNPQRELIYRPEVEPEDADSQADEALELDMTYSKPYSEKICPRCEQLRFQDDFYPDGTKKSGLSTYCKSCQSDWAHRYYRSERGWKIHLLGAARTRAKSREIPFGITIDDFEIPEFCPILGVKLEVTDQRGAGPNAATLDRIIPRLGYIPGNIQVVSNRANKMKSDADAADLRKFAAWINKTFPDVLEGG